MSKNSRRERKRAQTLEKQARSKRLDVYRKQLDPGDARAIGEFREAGFYPLIEQERHAGQMCAMWTLYTVDSGKIVGHWNKTWSTVRFRGQIHKGITSAQAVIEIIK